MEVEEEEEVEEEVEEEPKTCTRPAHNQEEEGEEPKTLSQDQHTTSTRHDQEEEELLQSNDKFDFITENQTSATGSSQLLHSSLVSCLKENNKNKLMTSYTFQIL